MTKNECLGLLLTEGPGRDVLFYPILMHFAARFHGKTYSEFATDYHVLVESNMHCLEYFDHDAASVISDPYRETAAFGAKIEFPRDAVPLCKDRILKTIDDVKSLKNPDVYASERTRDRIRGVAYYKKLLGESVPIIGWIEGPMAEACDLTGDSEILMRVITEPDFVSLLLEKCLKTAKDFARAQIEAGATVMGVGDALCSQISPSHYEKLVLPLHRELFDFIHSSGVPVKLHICGNITHLLSNLGETGADIIDIDWMVDFNEAHEKLGDGVAVCGNLDPVSVIQMLRAEELYTVSRRLIESETGKRFIFSGGCEITVDTPVENLKIMREASSALSG